MRHWLWQIVKICQMVSCNLFHNLPNSSNVRMHAEERQKRIAAHLLKAEFASLEDLAALVDTSVSTVRRDVSRLEGSGHVRRTHGGARWIAARLDDTVPPLARDLHQQAEKEAIGRACAALIAPHSTVIVDAGTTCYHVAKHLEPAAPQIFTNSLPVANHFAGTHTLEVVVSGGVIYTRLGVLVGPIAVEAFGKIRADVAIMSCGGITLDGISNAHGLLIEIQRAMIQAAERIIFCVDSSKFGRQSISKLCELDLVDVIVTDAAAPAEMVRALRRHGVEVVLAPRGKA
jgi:DeoR family transcriptional regulator, fructose operon transcriptional repressor